MSIELERRAASRMFGHPTDLGDVSLIAHYDEPGNVIAVEVVHADPRVLISGKLLRQIHDGTGNPTVPLAEVDYPGVGGTMKIRAIDRNLVYRITGADSHDAFIGEWPD